LVQRAVLVANSCGWMCGEWAPQLSAVAVAAAADSDAGAEAACCDAPEELVLVANPDGDGQPPSDDVPWEVTGDAFDASF